MGARCQVDLHAAGVERPSMAAASQRKANRQSRPVLLAAAML